MKYGGRFRIFASEDSKRGLQAVMGPISITTLPLIHTTDNPREISMLAIVETSVIGLLPDQDGELYTGTGCNVSEIRGA